MLHLDSLSLQDVCLFLDRVTLDTLSIASRILNHAVLQMPSSVCLRPILSAKFEYKDSFLSKATSRFPYGDLFVDVLKRITRPYRLQILPLLESHDLQRKFPNREKAIRLLLMELRRSNVFWLRVKNLPDQEEVLKQLLAVKAVDGCIKDLCMTSDFSNVTATIFEVGGSVETYRYFAFFTMKGI